MNHVSIILRGTKMSVFRKSAYFFQRAKCSDCQSEDSLFIHKYSDEVLCDDCAGLRLEQEVDNEQEVVLDDAN